ncbi:MAG: hypothetical protein J5950_01885 [Clostridia bacterium]|nr:hypothetical protein [Clostridia bacterium]
MTNVELAALACMSPEGLEAAGVLTGQPEGKAYDAYHCIKCGSGLGRDDAGAHKKFINRGASLFLCISCLADYMNVSEAFLREKIEHFRSMGCTLFSRGEQGI